MKQFIVLMAMIALGILIFGMIAGNGKDSLRNISGKAIVESSRESFGL